LQGNGAIDIKIAVQSVTGGWEVHVVDAKTDKPLLDRPPRQMRASESGAFPLPHETDLPKLPSGLPELKEKVIHDMYSRVVGGSGGKEGVAFGSYLFHTLIGAETWREIDKLAAAEPIELLLSWPATEVALNPLPWEMMHGPKLFQAEDPASPLAGRAEAFLAEDAQISITRVVAGQGTKRDKLTSPPCVLIVIGTGLDTDGIRPGAEYLGLLRKLRAEDLGLKTHLLLEASTERVEAAVKEFRPTVVHFHLPRQRQ
jgi:hypothetical protein